jgi:hypothetical protein
MYDPYTEYYALQAEEGYGGALYGVIQKGDAIGSFRGGLFRQNFPLFNCVVKALGKEALAMGLNLLRDALIGRPAKDSVFNRVTEAGTNLTSKAAQKLQSMVGSGYKKVKKRRQAQSRDVSKKRKVQRSAASRRRLAKHKDIFD